MAKALVLDDLLISDSLACSISKQFCEWDKLREVKVAEWKEIQSYVFATDTTKTSNSKLPWSNKTTLPKLTQIRDNLFANYMATLFPRRKWLVWEGQSRKEGQADKKKAIESYSNWVVENGGFYQEAAKLVADYIDYGNCFVTAEWLSEENSVDAEQRHQFGYVGPVARRISPLDIVFDPTASSFTQSPKIIRSMVSLGEVKSILERNASDETEKEAAEALFKYLVEVRKKVAEHDGAVRVKDETYRVAGFGDFRDYLGSNYAEVLTFYGDIFSVEDGVFYKNVIIQVVDRHKIILNKPNPSSLGYAPIFHCGWRIRPDNLWAMGPLDNLVGMQYRIDHLENLKADVFDLIAYPPVKITGTVEDFNWGPFEKIYVSEDGNVELMSPDVQALQADTQIAILQRQMEEMSGSPREAMGIRSPGEKTAYEVQTIENAASRIFQNKTAQLERDCFEHLLNAMLELAQRRLVIQEIRSFDPTLKIDTFEIITAEDISGRGRIKPVAARNFAERATLVQNISNFYGSAAGSDQEVKLHFSSVQLAKMWEELLDIAPYEIVVPYVRLSEQADAQRLSQSVQETVAVESQTATGIGDDFDQ